MVRDQAVGHAENGGCCHKAPRAFNNERKRPVYMSLSSTNLKNELPRDWSHARGFHKSEAVGRAWPRTDGEVVCKGR